MNYNSDLNLYPSSANAGPSQNGQNPLNMNSFIRNDYRYFYNHHSNIVHNEMFSMNNAGFRYRFPYESGEQRFNPGYIPSVAYNVRKDMFNDDATSTPPGAIGKYHSPLNGIGSPTNFYWNPAGKLERRDVTSPDISYKNIREKPHFHTGNATSSMPLPLDNTVNDPISYCEARIQEDSSEMSSCSVPVQNEVSFAGYKNDDCVEKRLETPAEEYDGPPLGYDEDNGLMFSREPGHDKLFFCKECGKNFSVEVSFEKSVEEHARLHHFNLYFCKFCGKSYRWMRSLNFHLEKMHPGCASFNCEKCGKAFKNNYSLSSHERDCGNYLGMGAQIESQNFEMKDSLNFPGNEGNVSCDVCAKMYKSKTALHKHMMAAHSNVNACDDGESSGSGESITVGHQNFCNLCQKTDCTHLMANRTAGVVKRMKRCGHCGKEFADKEILRSHLVLFHKEHNYLCDVCGKTFFFQDKFAKHSKVHLEVKSFKCTTCEKEFRYFYKLKIHEREHTGEKPYACHMCDKSFREKGTLKVHISRHTGENRYKCEICSKTFAYQSYRTTHMRVHTHERPFKCPECSKGFTQKSSLNLHLLTHSGEKKHKCTECEKAFTLRNYLIAHMRKHTGEKPYNCSTCKKAFTQRGSLNTHNRRCHNSLDNSVDDSLDV